MTEIEWIRDALLENNNVKLYKQKEERRYCIEFQIDESPYSFTGYNAEDVKSMYYQIRDIIEPNLQFKEFLLNVTIEIDGGFFYRGIKVIINEVLIVDEFEYSPFVPEILSNQMMVYLKPFSGF